MKQRSDDMKSILEEVKEEVSDIEVEEDDKSDYLKSALNKFNKIESIPKPEENEDFEILPENIKDLENKKFDLLDEKPKDTHLVMDNLQFENIKIEPAPRPATLDDFSVDETVIDTWKDRFLEEEEKPEPIKITPSITGKVRFTRNMSIGILRFPGTHAELETFRVLKSFGVTVRLIEYTELEKVADLNGFWLPRGYSFGDSERPGARASEEEMMKQVIASGKPVLGIGNGFHILTELNEIPGVLIKNQNKRFICDWINVQIPENKSYLNQIAGKVLSLPIAHYQGNVFAHDTLDEFIIAQYCDRFGEVIPSANPNGSHANIAGLGNEYKVGLMPHPERAAFNYHRSTDGRLVIEAFLREVKH